jgi:hypothetical protein
MLSPATAGWLNLFVINLGFAALHAKLYAVARSAGWLKGRSFTRF